MTVDFRFAPEVEAFRHEVRVFLEQEMAPEKVVSHGDDRDLTGLDEEFERALLRKAGARGFLGVSLPTEWGGGGRPAAFRAAFNLEVAAHPCASDRHRRHPGRPASGGVGLARPAGVLPAAGSSPVS